MKVRVVCYFLILLVMFISLIGFSYAYLSTDVINNIYNGKNKIMIDDPVLDVEDVSLIYDEDYEILAEKKNFTINSSLSNSNSCVKLYLNIDNISDNLKSEYFKYKISSLNSEEEGNFKNAINGGKILLEDNIYIEKNNSINFDLYIWLSHKDNINQDNLLYGYMKSNIEIENKNVRSKEECN